MGLPKLYVRQLSVAGLITQRSSVQIWPPLQMKLQVRARSLVSRAAFFDLLPGIVRAELGDTRHHEATRVFRFTSRE